MYVADGKNERVDIYDRVALTMLSSFGDGGRQPGQWFGAHSIATDSKGNLYTVETYEGTPLAEVRIQGRAESTAMAGACPGRRRSKQRGQAQRLSPFFHSQATLHLTLQRVEGSALRFLTAGETEKHAHSW
jgi:hypothetical protein